MLKFLSLSWSLRLKIGIPPNTEVLPVSMRASKSATCSISMGWLKLHGPDHCIQNTQGAEFVPGLNVEGIHEVVQKGTDPSVDSYSGFFDNGWRCETRLRALLEQRQVSHLFVMGLATDYCVKFTVLDALDLGFQTSLIEAGCRGVDLQPGDVEEAIEEMKQAGAAIV